MLLDRLFNLLNFVIRESGSGNVVTPENLNDLLPMASDFILNDELKKLVQDEMMGISNELLTTSPLRVFKTDFSPTVNTLNPALPTDYVRWAALGVSYGGSWRNIEVVDEREFNIRMSNVFYRPELKPFARLLNRNVYVIPGDITNVFITYIRKPKAPFYDWCIDNASYLNVYMPVGSYITRYNQPFNLYDANDVLLLSDVLVRGGVPSSIKNYDSQTVEIEWPEEVDVRILGQILSKVGLNLSREDLIQVMENDKK
jgi:hypothetical protein